MLSAGQLYNTYCNSQIKSADKYRRDNDYQRIVNMKESSQNEYKKIASNFVQVKVRVGLVNYMIYQSLLVYLISVFIFW